MYTLKIMFVLYFQRPTLQYDGLHDRALKHYFSMPEVKTQLTKMEPVSISLGVYWGVECVCAGVSLELSDRE